MTPFAELGIVILVAAIFGLIASWLRQPPLIGYIAAGLLLGPFGGQIVENVELLHLFSELGIALLLFIVGLELHWQSVRKVGGTAAQLALIQTAVIIGVGLILGGWLRLPVTESLVLGLALAFSSTIVVLKLITAKNDVQSLYGRLAVGVLLMQDLIAVLVLVLLPTLTNGGADSLAHEVSLLISKLVILGGVGWFNAQFILPRIWHRLARNRELLLLSSIGWCFLVALAARALGFSTEIGAFVAGLSLAATPYSEDISHQIRPLRDFFIVIFFVLLGVNIAPGTPINWPLVVSLTVSACLVKPLIIIPIMTGQHYRVRTSWLTALSLGQLSEFSVILALVAADLNLISDSTVGSIIIATAISLGLSSYLVVGAERLFGRLRPLLVPLEHKGHFTDRHLSLEHVDSMADHVIIFGYHRMGFHILRTLKKMKQDVLIVDFNPDVIDRLRSHKVMSVFGDAADPDVLETINVKEARLLISTIPYLEENLALIAAVRRQHQIAIITTANTIDDALMMYKAGADHVILPTFLGGEYVASLLEEYQTGKIKKFFDRHKADSRLLKAKRHALYFD